MAKINIRGDIVVNEYKRFYDWLGWDCVCPRDVQEIIDSAAHDEPLDVYINSPGGIVEAGQEDGRGAVSAADDADGSSLGTGEANHQVGSQAEEAVQGIQGNSTQESHEHTQLSGSAQQQGLGIRQQGAEVSHGADTHEDQTGIKTGFNTDVEEVQQTAVTQDLAVGVVSLMVCVHEVGPQLLVVQAGAGQVGQQAAESDAAQQQGIGRMTANIFGTKK